MAEGRPSLKPSKKVVIREGIMLAAKVMQPIAGLASYAGVPALGVALSIVSKISDVVDTMQLNKKQARRLAQSAQDIVDTVDAAVAGLSPEQIDATFRNNISRLVTTLQRIEEQLRRIAALGFVRRLASYLKIQEELVDLDKDIQGAARVFLLANGIDVRVHQAKIERAMNRAKEDDKSYFLEEVKRVTANPDMLAKRIGLHGNKVDSESTEGLQVILHRIDNDPTSIPPEVKEFAEIATKTIKSRTNYDVPRTFPWTVKQKDIEKGPQIGSGGFSLVYKGVWITQQKTVAIKVFRDTAAQNISALFDEIYMWRRFSHEFLHPFLGAAFETQPFIISPYCRNGNALEYLKAFPEANRLGILHDVSRGMQYLHANDVVHGDLKARNVLVDDDCRALVADFGLAQFERPLNPFSDPHAVPIKSPGGKHTLLSPDELVGTLRWLAPECFIDGKLTGSTDIWAMGMMAYEIFTDGEIPLEKIDDELLGRDLLKGVRPDRPTNPPIHDIAWVIMNQCWCLDPLERPSFKRLSTVIGVFQSCVHSLGDGSSMFVQEFGTALELAKWPGLLEQIVKILASSLEISAAASAVATSWRYSLLPENSRELISATLQALSRLAKNVAVDHSVGHAIVESGSLKPLVFILHAGMKIPFNVVAITCEILERLAMGWKNDTVCAAISDDNFVRALSQLTGSSNRIMARKAFVTLRKIIVANETSSAKLQQKKRAIKAGIIPHLTAALASNEPDAVLEACKFVMLLGRDPTGLSSDDLKNLCPSIAALICYKDFKIQSGALETLHVLCLTKGQQERVRHAKALEKIASLWQGGNVPPLNLNTYDLVETLALDIHIGVLLETLSLRDNHPLKFKAVQALKKIGDQSSAEEKQALETTHQIISMLGSVLLSAEAPLVDAAKKAIDSFSTVKATPSLIALMESKDQPTRIKIMAIQSFKTIVSNGTDKEKLSLGKSDAIPLFRRQLSSLTNDMDDDDEKLRGTILSILSEIIWPFSGSHLELVSASYVKAGLIPVLVKFLSEELDDPISTDEWECLLTLSKLSSGSDRTKNALAGTEIFQILHDIMMEFSDAEVVNLAYEILEGMLSAEDEDVYEPDIAAAIDANIVKPLVQALNRTEVELNSAAAALSYLLMSQDPEDIELLEEEGAIDALTKYCTTTERAFNMFDGRLWAIVDHLRYPSRSIQMFGIFVTSRLLKGTPKQRRTVTNSGLRVALEECANSGDEEIGRLAKELLPQLGNKRLSRRSQH